MDALIETPGSGGRGPMGFIAGVFVFVLAGTGAAELAMPPKALKLVGQERRDAAQSAEQRSFWDGSLARSKEANFRLHGRVRRWLAPYWSAAMLGLGDVPNDDVIAGQGGWLFLRERVFLPDRPGEGNGRHLANLMGLASRALYSHGTELVCVPLPRKSTTCSNKLPEGIDCDARFDAAVVDALTARGVMTIDVARVWDGHPASELYLKYDSHWALPARRLLAEELKRALPGLREGRAEYSVVKGSEHVATDGLRFAGVDRGHPANSFFDAAADFSLALRPAGSEARIDAREIESNVLLVGTSFSELFQFRAHLCEVLQSPVEDASELGRMPLLSLERALITRPVDAFPRYVISEFPMHHAGAIHRGSIPTVRAALGIARQLDFAGRAQALPSGLFAPEEARTPKLHAPTVSYPPGSLLSSGDGVLGVRFAFDGEKNSKWTYSTAGAKIQIGANAGARKRAFPIVEGGSAPGYHASLSPTTLESLSTSVQATLVTDADLAGGFEFTGRRTAEGTWSAAPKRSVERHDSLALSWEHWTSGPVELTAAGEDKEGQAVEESWRFPDAQQVRFAIVTLGPFHGGRVDRVTLKGSSGQVTGTIAAQVRAR